MEASSAKKSTSLETLVIQNITNVNDLKSKLNEIIQIGKDYEYDVSSCVKSLLNNNDQDIVILAVRAVSELVKCEDKRETYAQKEIIEPVLKILDKEVTTDKLELIKQCCRALGNLCCDCDTSRKIILQSNGVIILRKLLEKSIVSHLSEIQMLVAKTLLNYGIGGQEFCQSIVQENILDLLERILHIELGKEPVDDDILSTAVLLLNVITDNIPEIMFSDNVNKAVLTVLKETASVEISELCLDILHAQAEHDSVKMLLATEGGLQLVCSRLEQLMTRREAGEFSEDDTEIEAVVKQACDLIIIVLTGDEAMELLYGSGSGEVYSTAVRWLHSPHPQLLSTAVLALGNFARKDDYCAQMMDNNIYDQLLDLFEKQHGICVEAAAAGGEARHATVVCHGAAAALRNLCVSGRVAQPTADRAGALMAAALETVTDPLVAYKLLGALRMLVHTHECVAWRVAGGRAAAAAARWGGGAAGAGAEAPRLLAWTARALAHTPHAARLAQVEGCVSSLVNMLLSSHSLMQNEATLALTLLANECLKKTHEDFDLAQSFTSQLIEAEIGKYVAVLLDTNLAKMPVDVAENLLAFLDITSKKNEIATDYKRAKLNECLQKFSDVRTDFSDQLKACIAGVMRDIANGD